MRHNKTLNLTLLAIFTALILLQSFVPYLGYIRILPALPSITTIVLTVSIAGALLGPKLGSLIGLVWGMVSLFMAYTQPGDAVSLLLFQNPIIAVAPRILVGTFSGLIAKTFAKTRWSIFGYGLSGLIGSLTNTVFVVLLTAVFFMNNSVALTSHLGAINQGSPLIVILMVAFGLNGVTEAVVSMLLTPIVVVPLARILKHAKS